jgi:hypothetical protein
MTELLAEIGWTPQELRREIAYAEIHDAFPVIEFLGLMDCELSDERDVVEDILSGAFEPEGRCPVNVMGGVLGGHPIAATGVGQVVELCLQALRRSENLVPVEFPHYMFAFNVGGPLTYNCVTLLCAYSSAQGSPLDFRISQRPHSTAADLDLTNGGLLEPGPARVLSATRLEFPPPGVRRPCHVALVESEQCAGIVRGFEGMDTGTIVNLVRRKGRLKAVPVSFERPGPKESFGRRPA